MVQDQQFFTFVVGLTIFFFLLDLRSNWFVIDFFNV